MFPFLALDPPLQSYPFITYSQTSCYVILVGSPSHPSSLDPMSSECSSRLQVEPMQHNGCWCSLLSRVRLSVTPWTAAYRASLSFTICRSLLNQTHWVGDAIQSSRPLLSPSLPVFPSTTVFSSESALHIRWPKYWSFSFSISPSNEYSTQALSPNWLY